MDFVDFSGGDALAGLSEFEGSTHTNVAANDNLSPGVIATKPTVGDISLMVVPEPGTLCLALPALGLLALRRRSISGRAAG